MSRLLQQNILLHLSCGSVLIFFTMFLGVSEGFSSYLLEISAFTVSIEQLLLYVLFLCLYAVGIEFILRFIQAKVQSTHGEGLALFSSALLYGLSHLRHGSEAFLYAFCIGLITAFAYQHWKDWKILAMWHLQWDLAALGTFLILALCNISPYSNAVGFGYKRLLMEEGRILYRKDVGWIDAAHYWGAQRRACEVFFRLEQGEQKMKVTTHYLDLLGQVREHSFVLDTSLVSGTGVEQKAKEITLIIAKQEESFQEQASIWSGLRLSAWNAEDMRSVELALHDLNRNFTQICSGKNKPMPFGFQPPKTESNPLLWPSFDAFVQSGLP